MTETRAGVFPVRNGRRQLVGVELTNRRGDITLITDELSAPVKVPTDLCQAWMLEKVQAQLARLG
jgi:hypothetical protein